MKDNYLKKELYELIKTDESIFDFIQESSLDGLWYWDLENPEEEWMNPKFWTVLGYNPEEMPHKSTAWQNIINQDDLKVALDNFTKHCENPNHPYDQIVRYTHHKDGSTVWIRSRGLAIRDNSGKPVRMLGAHNDVTELKKAENEFNVRSAIFHEAEKITKTGSWELDVQTGQTLWSDEVYAIYEVDKNFEHNKAKAIEFVHPDDREVILNALSKATSEQIPFDEELRFITANKTEKWVRSLGKPIVENGKVSRIIGVISDVTERKQIETDLQERIKELDCLQTLSKLIEEEENLDLLLQKFVVVMPISWFYPEIACARILFEGRRYQSDNFSETDWKQIDDIKVMGKKVGTIEVCYLEECPVRDEGPFLKEERRLINLISERLGRFIEHKRVEEKLRENEKKYRLLFETMVQGVVYHDAEGGVISANPAAERILGLSFDQMQGRLPFDQRWGIINEDGTEIPVTDYPAAITLRTGKVFGPEVRGVFHPDKNAHIWVSIIAVPLFRQGETKPFQVYAMFEDITERKKAEEALQESEDRFKKLSSFTFEGTVVHKNGVVIDVNQSAVNLIGYNRDEIIGMNVFKIIQPDYHARVKENITKEIATPYQVVVMKRDGSTFDAEIEARNITHNGEHFRVACVRDITERKKAEEALKESEEKFRLITENATDVIWILNVTKEKFTYISPSVYNLRGYTPEEAMQEDIHQSLTPESAKEVLESIGEILPGFLANPEEMSKKTYRNELNQYCKDGSIIWIETNTRYQFNSNNEVEVIGISRNITERKKAEEALQESEKRFQKMLGVVPDMISIQNPEMDILYSNWHGLASVPQNKQLLHTKCYKTYRNYDDICSDCFAKTVMETRKLTSKETQFPKINGMISVLSQFLITIIMLKCLWNGCVTSPSRSRPKKN